MVRLVHGLHQNTSDQLRRTIYYEFQSQPWVIKADIKPSYPINSNWVE